MHPRRMLPLKRLDAVEGEEAGIVPVAAGCRLAGVWGGSITEGISLPFCLWFAPLPHLNLILLIIINIYIV